MLSFPHPQQVPGLEAVDQALRRAGRIPPADPTFRVCVCDREGRIVAAANMEGFDRVKRFSREMARLGYAAHIPGHVTAGCDITYTPEDGARDIFDDGEPLTDPAPLR